MPDDHLVDEMGGGAFGLVPLIGSLLAPLGRRATMAVREEWKRNGSRALKAAEQASGLSREDLAEAIADDPRLVPLVTRVLFEAGMTGQDETLAALGAALGDAVRDRDQIELVEILLGALATVRKHHIEVLRVLSGSPPLFHSLLEGQDKSEVGRGWSADNIWEHVEMPKDYAALAVTGLTNAGLVSQQSAWGGFRYEVSELGQTLLDVLAQLDRESH